MVPEKPYTYTFNGNILTLSAPTFNRTYKCYIDDSGYLHYTWFDKGTPVEELQQAQSLLTPLLGEAAGIVFALALLMAGISSTVTSGMAAGSIFSGIFGESYNIKDIHSKVGVILSLGIALMVIFFIDNPFHGLIISQMILSIQLPFTVFLQVGLTSSSKVMGKYANSTGTKWLLYGIAAIVSALNIMLLISEL